MNQPMGKGHLCLNHWLVVYLPLWKMWVRQLGFLLGLWSSQDVARNVPNHQPAHQTSMVLYGIATVAFVWGTIFPVHSFLDCATEQSWMSVQWHQMHQWLTGPHTRNCPPNNQVLRLSNLGRTCTGWWLTAYPSEKYEFVIWDDEIPNIWKNITCSKPPTSARSRRQSWNSTHSLNRFMSLNAPHNLFGHGIPVKRLSIYAYYQEDR